MVKEDEMIRLAMIGCGGRGQGLIELMDRRKLGATVVAIADPRQETLKKDLAGRPWLAADAAFFTDADELLNRSALDGVIVATRCSLHTTMGIKVLERDLPGYWSIRPGPGHRLQLPVLVRDPPGCWSIRPGLALRRRTGRSAHLLPNFAFGRLLPGRFRHRLSAFPAVG